MFVKPNPERKVGKEPLKVYDPVHNDFLPEAGRKVVDNAYWMRRLATKDVVEVAENQPTEEKTAAKAAKNTTKAKTNKDKAEAKAKKETTPTEEKTADATATNENKGD
ncbi:MAG: DUF2635 domain-containing protein [Alphaproteobacteria bacterium]|nr:DUF2635 domain-containing protein [Alphaproteobacteria bacterium]